MKRLLIISSFFVSLNVQAQLTNLTEIWKDHEFKGDELYLEGLYEAAIEYYSLEFEDDKVNHQAMAKMARAYKKLGNYKEAGRYFGILGNSFQLDTIYFEDYADVLLANQDTEKALKYYQAVLDIQPDNIPVANKISGIRDYSEYFRDEEYTSIQEVTFNTESSEYAIRKMKENLTFVSSRITDRIVQHNYLRDESKLTTLYKLKNKGDKANAPLPITFDKYRSRNDGPITGFGDEIAVSRSNISKGEYRFNLGIYFYSLDSLDRLVFSHQFPHNSPDYSTTHPAFSSNGDTLFFASDMPGGYGGLDIYYSVRRNSIWSAPVNIGPGINTSKNEIYPYSSLGTLYFSSDGHPGLGGIDTYLVKIDNGDVKSVNLGSPINSGWDDFAIYTEGSDGFISSNRPGGKGLDDIYSFFSLPKPKIVEPVSINLSILDKLNDLPVDKAEIILMSESDTLVINSDENGAINSQIMPGEYNVNVRRQPYIDFTFNISIEEGNDVKQMILLEPAIAIHVVSPDSIMFKFGDYTLLHEEADEELDAIVKTLVDYPELNLIISAHTDSRGEIEYNQWLSERRAETAANYIINAGIDADRIQKNGYGETRLLNNCRDGVRCLEKFHAVNRRLEFDFERVENK